MLRADELEFVLDTLALSYTDTCEVLNVVNTRTPDGGYTSVEVVAATYPACAYDPRMVRNERLTRLVTEVSAQYVVLLPPDAVVPHSAHLRITGPEHPTPLKLDVTGVPTEGTTNIEQVITCNVMEG